MKHDVILEFNLTNPEELNIYNMIRNLEGIKNAIVNFKSYMEKSVKDLDSINAKTPEAEATKMALLSKVNDIFTNFEKLFKENGVTV